MFEKKRGREGELAGIADKELTSSDRKRLRRARKEVTRKKTLAALAKDQTAARVNPHSHASARVEDRRTEKLLRHDKRVVSDSSSQSRKIGGSGFFGRLQEQVSQEVRSMKKDSSAPVAVASSSGKATFYKF